MSSGAPGALAWLRAFAIPAASQHVPQGYSPFCLSLRKHVFACAQISRAHRPGAAPCWRVVGADRRARGEAPFDAKDPEKISERSRAPSCASRSLRGAAFWRGDGRGPHLRQELGAQLLMMVLNSRGLSQWGSGMRACGSCHVLLVHSPQSAAGLPGGSAYRGQDAFVLAGLHLSTCDGWCVARTGVLAALRATSTCQCRV